MPFDNVPLVVTIKSPEVFSVALRSTVKLCPDADNADVLDGAGNPVISVQ